MLGVNFIKIVVGHFANDLEDHVKVIQVKITEIFTFALF